MLDWHLECSGCAAARGPAGLCTRTRARFDLVLLGMGDDGTFWGGELLHADLRGYHRLG
mgnify:CR=1 FL=1